MMDLRVEHLPVGADLDPAKEIRRAVFSVEDGIPRSEVNDNQDGNADQFMAYDGDKPIGTARFRTIGDRVKIERVAVLSEYRGLHVGAAIMHKVIEVVEGSGMNDMTLNSKVSTRGFYEKLGFTAEGEEFMDNGILHIKMRRLLSTNNQKS